MFDKEAIQELSQSQAIEAAATSVSNAMETDGLLALPSDFKTHDLEKYMPARRRARGGMHTPNVGDFAKYTAEHKEAGATVFVDQDEMAATAVLNLGTPEAPGHADNTAIFQPVRTAAYRALLRVDGVNLSQGSAAEFLEDWAEQVKCEGEAGDIEVKRAVAAMRKLTIEGMKKLEAEEGQLSASRSTFESVKATSAEPIPATITFNCVPYHGFKPRDFVLRLGIRTGGDKPTITLRQVNAELHAEQMAEELAAMVQAQVKDIPVLIGGYGAK